MLCRAREYSDGKELDRWAAKTPNFSPVFRILKPLANSIPKGRNMTSTYQLFARTRSVGAGGGWPFRQRGTGDRAERQLATGSKGGQTDRAQPHLAAIPAAKRPGNEFWAIRRKPGCPLSAKGESDQQCFNQALSKRTKPAAMTSCNHTAGTPLAPRASRENTPVVPVCSGS